MLLAPVPCCTRGLQTLLGKCRGIAAVAPRRNCHYGSQACCGACTFIRRGVGADYIIRACFVLRHDERTEIVAGLLLPHTAIAILEGEHPLQIPLDLR